MKTLMITTLVVLINTQVVLVAAQSRRWKVYSPPDKTFSVVVPEATNSVERPEQTSRTCSMFAHSLEHTLRETIPRETRFGVVVLDGRAGILRKLIRQKALEHLSWNFIAEEDEPGFFRTTKRTMTHGLVGHEYFYIKDSGTPLFARGRIFDTGKRIYILVFRAQHLPDLMSVDANRFFSSFRLLKRG
jgi:hypothetical protein